MGTVTMAAADHVMVQTKDGKVVTAAIGPETKIMRGKTTMTLADLKQGSRVVITLLPAKEPSTAKEIQLGVATTTSTKSKSTTP